VYSLESIIFLLKYGSSQNYQLVEKDLLHEAIHGRELEIDIWHPLKSDKDLCWERDA
jgi:hypothetical protein